MINSVFVERNVNEAGDSAVCKEMIDASSVEEADQYAKDKYPVTRCMHSHDCCGHWYQHAPPKIEILGKGLYMITVRSIQNV